jgi:hypothetical protein
MCDGYCKEVDRIAGLVRTGDFDHNSVEQIWNDRDRVSGCGLHELRIRTIVWDAYQGCGKYQLAAERLRERDFVVRAVNQIHESKMNPGSSLAAFRQSIEQQSERKKPEYRFWRQCAMDALATRFPLFQLQEPGAEEIMRTVGMFLHECLGKLDYADNGARARLHFFRGIIYESNYQMEHATEQYDLSLSYCIARAVKKLLKPQSFVVYRPGKLELKLNKYRTGPGVSIDRVN